MNVHESIQGLDFSFLTSITRQSSWTKLCGTDLSTLALQFYMGSVVKQREIT